MHRFPTLSALTLLALVGFAAAGCSEARLQPVVPEQPPPLDNKLEIRGEFCTEPSADVTFPVKVLFVIDQSASLQCTDSMNRRFAALNDSIDTLRRQPNTQFGFIGFSSWARMQDFTRDRGQIQAFVDPAAGLGPATDYQGSLATAIRMIENDIKEIGAAERARTRYVINFVSDGVPEPRCNAGCEDTISDCSDGEDNDGDGIIDGADPDCANIMDNNEHPDNLYGVCNTDQEIPEDVYVDMDGICPEYNQPPQILRRVQELKALTDAYSVGGVTLNTVLLFSPQSVVEGICPGASDNFGYNKQTASALLQAMADEGDGSFRDVNLTSDDSGYLDFGITSLKAEQTLTSMSAHNVHGRLSGAEEPEPDNDGDGLSNIAEVKMSLDRNDPDTDGDRYSDLFEHYFRSEGFDPLDPEAPAVTCPDDRDGDGDGLNDCEEAYLETDPVLPDTDGDGILDWHEFLHKTDPKVLDHRGDDDFDGILNGAEIKGGTNPIEPDAESYRESHVAYDLDDRGLEEIGEEGDTEERHCYDFSIEDIELAITPIPSQRGLNRILIYTSERAARVAGVPGEVRVACFEAFWNGGRIKQPASGVIDVSRRHLDELREQLSDDISQLTSCSWFQTRSEDRSSVQSMIDECMNPKVELDERLYLQEELFELLAKNFDGNNVPKLPARGFELFVPIQNFDPGNDCFRPWEFDLLSLLFQSAYDACLECVGEEAEGDGDAG